jgi:hypothetical protein
MGKLSIFAKSRVRNIISLLGYSVRRTDPLTILADLYGTDKGSTASAHGYCRIYNSYFKHLRMSEIILVEIGLGSPNVPSLRMWVNYFDRARIYGFDKEDFSRVNFKGATIIRGDMAVEQDLDGLARLIDQPITILIDDGSHRSYDQQFALGTMFPHLCSGGIYAIEDMHLMYDQSRQGDLWRTRDVLRSFSLTGVMDSPYMSELQRRYLENNIDTVTLYDSLTAAKTDVADALAILIKK